jgi:hypothetical protein
MVPYPRITLIDANSLFPEPDHRFPGCSCPSAIRAYSRNSRITGIICKRSGFLPKPWFVVISAFCFPNFCFGFGVSLCLKQCGEKHDNG